MSKTHAFFLALLCAALFAVAVPVGVVVWRFLMTQVSAVGLFGYSTILGCVAAPFLYVMFRRMK